MRTFRVLALALCIALIPSTAAAADCQFVLGFKTLRDLIGHGIVGQCLENQHHGANGDALQQTTGGLLVWRKADNWTAFTDGYRTWINGPNGLVQRLNTERFEWEADYAPGGEIATPTPTPTQTRVIDSDLAAVLEVMASTSSGKILLAWFDEAVPSLTYGELPEDLASDYYEPPRNEIVLGHSMRNESPEVQAAVIAWETVFAVNTKRHGQKNERWLSGTDCMEEVVAAEETWVRWWIERFGSEGMQNAATDYEDYLNGAIEYYQNGSLGALIWLFDDFYSEWCAPYGEIGPYIDPRLDRVFATMSTTATGRTAYAWFLQAGASASFANVEGGGGQYQRSLNLVTLDHNLRSKPVSVSAAVLAHEIYHVKHATGESGEACLEGETAAHRFQALWWQEFHGAEKSGVDEWHDGLLYLYQRNLIGEWVRDIEFYQEKCQVAAVIPAPTPAPTPSVCPTTAERDYRNRFWTDLLAVTGTVTKRGSYEETFTMLNDALDGRVYASEAMNRFFAFRLEIHDLIVSLPEPPSARMGYFRDLLIQMRDGMGEVYAEYFKSINLPAVLYRAQLPARLSDAGLVMQRWLNGDSGIVEYDRTLRGQFKAAGCSGY